MSLTRFNEDAWLIFCGSETRVWIRFYGNRVNSHSLGASRFLEIAPVTWLVNTKVAKYDTDK